MRPAELAVTMLGGREPGDALAYVALGRGVGAAFVYPDGSLYVDTAGWSVSVVDLRRLADIADAVIAGTYQDTPTFAEICETARLRGAS